jgi:hypothetical protein
MRLNDGEIQVILDPVGADHGVASSAWTAILPDGSLVAPGSAGTLKYDMTNAAGGATIVNTVLTNVSDGTTYSVAPFESTTTTVTIPAILKQLGLFPGTTGLGNDYLYARNVTERFPFRGGNWHYTSAAGVFFLNLDYSRAAANTSIGFRPLFVSAI